MSHRVSSVALTPNFEAPVSTAGLKSALVAPGFWLFAGSSVFCWLCLFRLSGTPIWTGGDQAMWLHDGQRMFFGEVLYRDFFQMTFPGTELLYLGAFKLFGLRTWIPSALLVITGATLTWLIYSLSRRVLSPRHALLPPLLFLTLVYHDLLDASHHWLSIVCCAAATAVVVERRTPWRLFFSGVFLGLATSFTQSHGAAALAGLVVFLYFDERQTGGRRPGLALFRKFGMVLAGAGLAVILIIAPFVWKAGLPRFFYCTVVYVLRYYSRFPGGSDWSGYMTGLFSRLDLWHPWRLGIFLLVHLLLPLVYLLTLLRYFRGALGGRPQDDERLLLIALIGLGLFLSVVSGPEWNRLYYVSFPALILFVFFLAGMGKVGGLLLDAALGATLLLAISVPVRTQWHKPEYLDLPGGRTAFLSNPHLQEYRWVISRTEPFEYLFAPFSPDYYFLLGLRNPATVPVMSPFDFTRPEDVAKAIDGLERHQVRLILWSSELDLAPSPQGDHLGPLRAYMAEHYCVTQTFEEKEVWFRREHPVSIRACPGTAPRLRPTSSGGGV